MSHCSIRAKAILQYLRNDLCSVASEKTYNEAILSLVRDDKSNTIYFRIEPTNKVYQSVGFPVLSLQIYDRLAEQGLSTVKLNKSKVQVMISNCGPDNLKLFLSTLKIKSQSNISKNTLVLQRKLGFELMDSISPVSKCDIKNIQNKKLQSLLKSAPVSPISKLAQCGYDNDDKILKKQTMKRSMTFNEVEYTAAKKPKLTSSISNLKESKISEILKDESICGKNLLRKCKTLDVSLNDSFQMTETYKLSEEQITVLNKVKTGENIFFTGSAGTGKTYLMKKIINSLPIQYTAVTASTGIAASLIDGITLHTFAGIGAEIVSVQESITRLKKRTIVLNNWRKIKHLIVDEISLITAEYFDHLDKVARIVRNKINTPFGGIQLILCGDFLQLPPVIKRHEENKYKDYKFAFQSKVWQEAMTNIMELKEVHRQSDKLFIDILNDIRIGKCSSATSEKLLATRSQNIEKNGIKPTKLCSLIANVDRINIENLNNLEGDSIDYYAIDSIKDKQEQIRNYCRAESRITLKAGAQVLLLKNLSVSDGLANGSRGVVTEFLTVKEAYNKHIKIYGARSYIGDSSKKYPLVKFISGLIVMIKPEVFTCSMTVNGYPNVVTRTQLPLNLAYSISIHKSQGMTLDCVELYLDNVFASGQAYVALSRCQSLESMRVMSWSKNCVFADKDVLAFYNIYKYQQDNLSTTAWLESIL